MKMRKARKLVLVQAKYQRYGECWKIIQRRVKSCYKVWK